MTEIKRCPFCGELPVVCLKHGDMHNVSCETVDCCGENDLWWETEQEAIEAWNTRHEPTCEYEIDQVPEGGPVYATCTNCGWQTDVDYIPMPKGFNYCPNCGSKVVDS